MDVSSLQKIVQVLRERLKPVEVAGSAAVSAALQARYPGARGAGVLLALFEQDGEAAIAFIRRASTLRQHSGEIALPGGSIDSTDLSLTQTALREAQEEIGLEPERVEILGMLPPIFTVVSNFVIMPVVGFLPRGTGNLRLQASEVAELILVPVRQLADPGIARVEHWTRGGSEHRVYFYDYGQYCIWGATGRIVYEFLAVLGADEVPA